MSNAVAGLMALITTLYAVNKIKNRRHNGVVKGVPEITSSFKNSLPIEIDDAVIKGSVSNLLKMEQTKAENKALDIVLRILVYVCFLILIAVMIFNFVLPSSIIDKYTSNNNSVPIDNDLYNISIATLVFSCLSILTCIISQTITPNIVPTIFLLATSSITIAKAHGSMETTDESLYGMAVCTILTLLFIGGPSTFKTIIGDGKNKSKML
jgi:hypothetical protein